MSSGKLEIPGREIIYNMPEEQYHKLPRLSSSGIKKLLVSSQDFWDSFSGNTNKKDKTSDVFNLGRAYHARIIEGDRAFRQRYAVKPNCDRRTTEGKTVYAQWKALYPSASEIDQEDFNEITDACKMIDAKYDFFKNGHSEVTILWNDEETNVPMKARIDYLKTTENNDLKTFSNPNGQDLNKLLANHIVKYKYYIQAAVYDAAIPGLTTNFVFTQTGGPPNIIVKPFPHDLMLFGHGQKLMRDGINKFAENYKIFGSNPWYDDHDIKPFIDEDFPLWVYDE